jgi:thymidylate synthase (FAD)
MAKVISTENIPLLDHGYLKLVEFWGSDESVICAARMSTDGAFKGWGCWKCDTCGLELDYKQGHTSEPGVMCSNEVAFARIPRDEKLLRYLWENRHHTPFEMAGLTIEVQAPIFVFREWHRHRVPFSYNELSARYTPLPDLNYIPTVVRLMINAGTSNKQAGTIKGAEALSVEAAQAFRENLEDMYGRAQLLYERALASGVPKELARVHLPVGRYSRMRASANLRGWLNFLSLRMASGAQWEIRQYANALGDVIKEIFPRTWELFAEGFKHEQ